MTEEEKLREGLRNKFFIYDYLTDEFSEMKVSEKYIPVYAEALDNKDRIKVVGCFRSIAGRKLWIRNPGLYKFNPRFSGKGKAK